MEKGGAGNEHGIFFSFFFINSILYTYIIYHIIYNMFILYINSIYVFLFYFLYKRCAVCVLEHRAL